MIIHNEYLNFGGEDQVLHNEVKLLNSNSYFHKNIDLCLYSNKNIKTIKDKMLTSLSLTYSKRSYANIYNRLKAVNPLIAHIHNFFPLISPSVFFACNDTNTPCVLTLHNYRTICPTATLSYKGKITEKSLQKPSWWAIPKRVYRNSFVGTTALAYMVEYHKFRKTWQRRVDHFIALTEFSKQKFIASGYPEEKITVKPNFVEDPHQGVEKIGKKDEKYAIFVGRLSEEKGLDTLLEAWRHVNYPLKIVGTGPLENRVISEIYTNPRIEFLGFQNKSIIQNLMKNSSFLVMPSIWYETFGLVMIEAFSNGTPALVSNIGSMAEIVNDGYNGLHFEVGNADALAGKANFLIDNSKLCFELGCNARTDYLAKYTPGHNLDLLLDIYRKTILSKFGKCPF